ncbi:MAG: hypothetical protein ACTSPW_19500 [Promethearchaeota archaeon]
MKGKEIMENINGDRVTEFKVEVTAKDRNGNILGKGTCPAFSLNEEGLKKAVKRYGYKGVVQRLNRMIKTDARNDLASKKSIQAQMKAMEKENVDFAKEIKALREKWGIKG